MATKPKPLSLRAYAKLRKCTVEAVSKAIASGRLRESVVRVGGAPKIADAKLADREWEANTQVRAERTEPAPRDLPEYFVSRSQRETAAARREAAQAELAELELAERKGRLIPVEQARRDVMDRFAIVKTRILGVPRGVAQQLPEMAPVVVPVLEDLLREALRELADSDAEPEPGDGGERA